MPIYPPVTAREELNGPLNASIEMALKLISKHGNHIPFAMVVTVDGERINMATDDAEVRDSAILIQSLLRELRQMVAGNKVRAIAFAHNVTYQSPTGGSVDAIEVDLDHLDERPVTCMLPYKFEGSNPVPGDLFAMKPRMIFFAHTT